MTATLETIESKQAEAEYRCTLKRFLRHVGVYDFDAEGPTKEIERLFRDHATRKGNLSTFGEYFDARSRRLADKWAEANNSGNNRAHAKGCDDYERKTDASQRAAALLGISSTYPGLFPSLQINGHSFDCMIGLVKWETLKAGEGVEVYRKREDYTGGGELWGISVDGVEVGQHSDKYKCDSLAQELIEKPEVAQELKAYNKL